MTKITQSPPPVVVLAGFMGSGKTEVGRALAEILNVEFIDTDSVVESRAGMKIREMFDSRGEKFFRGLEATLCRELAPKDGAVIASGGGMLLDKINFERLSSLGTMVLLECSLDTTIDRVRRTGRRPLLQPAPGGGKNGAEKTQAELKHRIEALLKERLPAYNRIRFRVDTSDCKPADAAAEIAARLDPPHHVISIRADVRPIPSREDKSAREHAPEETDGASHIVVGRGVAGRLGPFLDRLGMRSHAFLLVPYRLRDRFLERVVPSLEEASIPYHAASVKDDETNKTLQQVSDLLDQLAATGADRASVVVTIGGGITGDLGGFTASAYMRGLPFVQVPTTLLAQVDASIGGKVGVNHPRAKNLIGAFYQPRLVLSDVSMLDGLPLSEIANGMAEVVKSAIIGSPELFQLLRETAGTVSRGAFEPAARDPGFLERCVLECARIKSDIVERDPYERDLRRVLNLGHTLGHALETALEYKRVNHGEAVALGLMAAIRVAVARGRADKSFLEDTSSILGWCSLPVETPPVGRDALRRALQLDKKKTSGRLRFVLPLGPGRVEVVDDASEGELLDAL